MPRIDKSFLCALCAVLMMSLPASIVAQSPEQPNNTLIAAQTAHENSPQELPDSPGAMQSAASDKLTVQDSSQQQRSSTQSPSASASPQSATSEESQKSTPQRPVGTAAAEAPIVSGTTAAEPAGVAVAPAKQRRVRTIVLKVGAIIGAGVAVGTVVALSAGTPSKPPGAH